MGGLWFMLLSSVLCGGYAMSRLPHMKTKFGRVLLWISVVSNGLAVLVTAWAIALLGLGQWS